MAGKLEALYLKLAEAGNTSDFPYLLGDQLHKSLLATYAKVITTWRDWCKIEPNIQDFKENYRIQISETEDLLEVTEARPAEEGTISESRTNYLVKIYERVFGVPWQLLVNDDLGAIKQHPQRMGRAAARTVAKFAVALLVARTASVTVTTALSATTLGTAINEFKTRTESKTGDPLGITPKYLIVPPALEITAKQILNSTLLIAIGVGSTAATQGAYNAVNKAESGLELRVEPFLTDANDWYLVADPGDVPGIEIGFFRGWTEPRIYLRSTNVQGNDNPFDMGDFESHQIKYKVSHIYGGTMIDDNAILHVEVA